MKLILTLAFLLGAGARAEEVLVGIPDDGTDQGAVAAQIGVVAAAQTQAPVEAEDTQTGQKLTFNIRLETGNHIINKGTPLTGFEKVFPGPIVFLAFGGEVSYKEWVSFGAHTGAANGLTLDAHPFKWFAPRAPIHDYKLQPFVGYRWYRFTQRGTSDARQPGQLYHRTGHGLAWGLSYALSKRTKVYVQAGNQSWKEEYFVQTTPWINGPAETRFENKKRGTVFVGVSFKIP